MNYFQFKQMKKEDIPVYSDAMFSVLSGNMSAIAPTGNTYDEDYIIWSESVIPIWNKGLSNVILMFCEDKLCGYFQYRVNSDTFKMDEIQFSSEYQGSGLFKELFHFLIGIIPENTKYTEAYARKENIKSQNILKHLGLEVVGESKNGNSLHFQGEYKTLLKLYS